MSNRTVSVLLPALNEEASIRAVIEAIPREAIWARGYRLDLAVVDGHSVDRTMEIARNLGARCIIQDGRGKGDALRSAFRTMDSDYVFMLDADSTYPPRYIPRMLSVLEQGWADVVVGSRLDGFIQKGAMSALHRFGNHALTSAANLLFANRNARIGDVCTGMWGFRGDVIQELDIRSDGFEVEAEMFARFAKRGYRMENIPIDYYRREGQAKLSGIGDGFRIFGTMLKERVLPQ